MTGTERLGAGRYIEARDIPASTMTTVHELRTSDQATATGILRTPPGARVVVTIMHPRQDVTHHVMVPELLSRGYAVWTQGSRSPNNDLALQHEQAIIDMAAGHERLRELGWSSVVSLGHSGGATLTAFYCQQAGRTPGERLTTTPAGRPVPLADTTMPLPDGVVFMAPHPGQGALLERVIDPSVTDESDPLSVDPALDPFSPANGFVDAPGSSSFDPDFVARYRAAQRRRVERIDATARERVALAREETAAFKGSGDPAHRRRALAPRLVTVFRTDADLRNVDLSIDPNDRPYGSLFGRRPDLTNYGLVGFGRTSTPEAWLSTWSSVSTRADFVECAPGVTVPTLLLGLTGDQASYPSDLLHMQDALASDDLTVREVRGTHFGGAVADGEPTGSSNAAVVVDDWLAERF
ncbi:MAG: alpha/beta hydrolase [Aeromicrobium sp.]